MHENVVMCKHRLIMECHAGQCSMSYAELLKRICFVGEDSSGHSHGWGIAHQDIVIGMYALLFDTHQVWKQSVSKHPFTAEQQYCMHLRCGRALDCTYSYASIDMIWRGNAFPE
jgi:hypothetical protein